MWRFKEAAGKKMNDQKRRVRKRRKRERCGAKRKRTAPFEQSWSTRPSLFLLDGGVVVVVMILLSLSALSRGLRKEE
jgi:hypothetical protein